MRLDIRDLAAWRALVLVLAAAALAGCGGAGASASHVQVDAARDSGRPGYRVGQFCETTKAARYSSAGLTCRKHHLVGR
jgi:hypothetical protein